MISEKIAVVWIFDSGSEDKFPVSFCSLKINSKELWNESIKIIIDVGISSDMRNWIKKFEKENVYIINIDLPSKDEAIGRKNRPAQIMLARLMLSKIIKQLYLQKEIPFIETFLYVDTDTAFFNSPLEIIKMEWIGEHLRAVKEWDWIGDPKLNIQNSMKLCRISNFSNNDNVEKI